MALGRELIYSSLFAQIKQLLLYPAGKFMYIGRRPVPIAKLALEQYPALFLVEGNEDYSRNVLYTPAKVTLTIYAMIHTNEGAVDDETNVPDLNNLADMFEDALQSYCVPTAQNVLNGLVQHAWIEGRQVVITGAWPQRWSEQIFGVKIILPHSR
jgi:hypothetical protein